MIASIREHNTVLNMLSVRESERTSWHSVQFNFDNFVVCKLVISICEWQAKLVQNCMSYTNIWECTWMNEWTSEQEYEALFKRIYSNTCVHCTYAYVYLYIYNVIKQWSIWFSIESSKNMKFSVCHNNNRTLCGRAWITHSGSHDLILSPISLFISSLYLSLIIRSSQR